MHMDIRKYFWGDLMKLFQNLWVGQKKVQLTSDLWEGSMGIPCRLYMSIVYIVYCVYITYVYCIKVNVICRYICLFALRIPFGYVYIAARLSSDNNWG